MILGAFDIKYMPHTSVRGQVLADLVAEFAELPEETEMKQHDMNEKSIGLISTQDASSWKVYVDGEQEWSWFWYPPKRSSLRSP